MRPRTGLGDYEEQAPHTIIGAMRLKTYKLIQEHVADGTIPTSLRFLFYEMVARGWLNKSLPEGDNRRPEHLLIGALKLLRVWGVVPWEFIVDETRHFNNYTGYSDIRSAVETVLEQIHLDPWDGEAPTVIVESRSLAGTLRNLARHYAVCLTATNGQVGGFLHTDVGPALSPGATCLYMGDYDLAGADIEANTRRVLEQIVGGELNWERIALTEAQVKKYKLQPIIKNDRRFKGERGKHRAVETEALSQKLIVKLLRQRLEALLPEPLDNVLEREARQRRAVLRLLRRRT
jgi:hypothetical protein